MSAEEKEERASVKADEEPKPPGEGPPRKGRRRQIPTSEVVMPESGLTTQQRKEVETAFLTFDTDKSGAIDAFELKLAMRALGMKVSEEEIAVIMEEVDVDQSG